MKIRLRKAQAILKKAQELLNNDKSINHATGSLRDVDIHVSNEKYVTAWMKHRDHIRSLLDRRFELEHALHWLAVETTRAGSTTVSVLLKEISLKKNTIKSLQELIDGMNGNTPTSLDSIEQSLLEKKHDAESGEKSIYSKNVVSVFWADAGNFNYFQTLCKTAQRELLKLEDELAAVNLSIEIELPKDIIEILDKHSLV